MSLSFKFYTFHQPYIHAYNIWIPVSYRFLFLNKTTGNFAKYYNTYNDFFLSVFLTYHFEDRILYSQTSPKQPLWGPKKVAVVERWSLWGGGGVIGQFLYCHPRTIWIKFPDHSWLVCQSLKKLAFVESFFLAAGDTVQWTLLL